MSEWSGVQNFFLICEILVRARETRDGGETNNEARRVYDLYARPMPV
jgi:hypothetical protein